MKLVTFRSGKKEKIGVVVGADDSTPAAGLVADVAKIHRFLRSGKAPEKLRGEAAFGQAQETFLSGRAAPADMIALLEAGPEWRGALGRVADALAASAEEIEEVKSLFRPLRRTKFKAPVPRPRKIIAVGLNYRAHAAEQGGNPPEKPMFFGFFANTVIGAGENIEMPPNSDQVDWEAELAVIIGRGGRRISEEQAMDHVAGYTCFQDVSARDMQFSDKQFFRGKGCDTFAPMGPWLVTADEIPDPHSLDISLRVNRKVMQNSNTSDLIFPIPFLISYLSQSLTWEAGDVLSTGTPGGVGVFRDPPQFLKPGDKTSVIIEKIGTLTNRVIGPAS